MKRLLALLLMLCLLAGCAAAPAPAPDPAPEPEPSPAPEPEPEPPAMLDLREPLSDGSAVSYLPCAALDGSFYTSLELCGDSLLFYGSRFTEEDGDGACSAGDLQLALLDRRTGLLQCEATLSGAGAAHVQRCGAQIAVCDWDGGTLYLYDDTLTLQAKYRVARDWCVFYPDDSAARVYCFTPDSGIQVIELADGARTTLLPDARGLYTNTRCGSSVTFNYVDLDTQMSCSALLDLDSGEISPVPFEGDFYSCACDGGFWLAGLSYIADGYLCGTADAPGMLELPGTMLSLLPGGFLYAPAYSEGETRTFALYDTEGHYLSGYTQTDAWDSWHGTPVYCPEENGFYLTAGTTDGKLRLLFWDLSVPTDGADLTVTPLPEIMGEPQPGSAVSQSLYDRAAALSEQYGVTIRIADQCETTYYTYTAEPDYDFWHISAGLDELEAALSSYPEGFFRQLCYDTYRETEINLVGALTPCDLPEGEVNGFTSFAAFVEHGVSKHIMVIDLNQYGSIEENCYHEFSHIIDAKLAFNAQYRDDARYSEEGWASCNPPGFEYTYNYYEFSDDVYTDGYDGYFVDTYARTFPTEDRARVLEYAMSGLGWIFDGGTQAPLREKLAYYAACIRDGFDTTGWPAVTAWEEPLQNTEYTAPAA